MSAQDRRNPRFIEPVSPWVLSDTQRQLITNRIQALERAVEEHSLDRRQAERPLDDLRRMLNADEATRPRLPAAHASQNRFVVQTREGTSAQPRFLEPVPYRINPSVTHGQASITTSPSESSSIAGNSARGDWWQDVMSPVIAELKRRTNASSR